MRTQWILLLVALGVAACYTRPPRELRPSLVASPELALQKPVDIAVLPVQDSTPGQILESLTDQMREDIGLALAQRLYSPLSASHVDSRVSESQVAVGSTVDANFVKGLTGRCQEDAVLGVRVTRWDERTIMDDGRVDFSAEVLMLSTDGAVLWSGRLDGSVKAGDAGPAPLARTARERSAVSVFSDALIDLLPPRR